MKGKRITEEQERYIVQNFADKTKQELAEAAGVHPTTIDRVQAKYHLRKSRQHLHNMGVRAGKASNIARGGDSSPCYTPEAIAKRVATYKERYKTEDMRVRWGFQQLTKMHLKRGPKHFFDQCSYLKHLGYIVDRDEKVAYYTPETHRATRLEKLARNERKGEFHNYFDYKPYDQRPTE